MTNHYQYEIITRKQKRALLWQTRRETLVDLGFYTLVVFGSLAVVFGFVALVQAIV